MENKTGRVDWVARGKPVKINRDDMQEVLKKALEDELRDPSLTMDFNLVSNTMTPVFKIVEGFPGPRKTV